jgi:hypothetical protein
MTRCSIWLRKGAVEDIEIRAAAGAEINAIGGLGNAPLHQAAMRGQVASIKKLLDWEPIGT